MVFRLSKNEKSRRHSIPFHHHMVRSRDGVQIRYFDTEEALPAIVFANGLGGPVSAWKPYLELWRGKYRVLSWDYRGLYGSLLPSDQVDLSVRSHAEDLQAVLEDAHVSDATFIGWSMGVQVGLEFYSLKQSHLSRLVFVSGTYGQPLKGLPLPFSGLALPHLVRRLQPYHHWGKKALDVASRSSLGYPLLRRLRIVAPGLTEGHYREMMDDFREIDLKTYLHLLTHLGEHDAEHMLTQVTLPALVVAGSRDLITPPWLSRRIAEKIPRSELFMITGATHYSAAEHPELIAERVELFIRAHGGI